MTTLISIVNHKGGVLKTTVTANLGAGLARAGKRVLLIDLDAQQNLSQTFLGSVPFEDGVPTLYDAIVEETTLDHLIVPTAEANLDIVPCTEDFAGADLHLVTVVGREHALKRCLQKTYALDKYDLVLMDNSPSFSLVVANSLAASSFFLVPCSAEYLPLVGLTMLGNSVARLATVAPDLRLLGVVITMFAKSEKICRSVESILRRELKEKLFEAKIRVNTKAKSAPGAKKTIFEYENDRQGRGTADFTALVNEFLQRLDAMLAQGTQELVANG